MSLENPTKDLVSTINRLNAKFEQAEEVCSDDVIEFIEAKQKDIQALADKSPERQIIVDGEVLMSRADVIKLQMMVDDYKEVRETLLSTVKSSRSIIDSLTLSLMDEDSETRADDISAYSSLVSTVNQSVKILASSYKDISSVLLNLDKLEKSQDISDKKVTINASNINIQSNQIISTTDLIKKLSMK